MGALDKAIKLIKEFEGCALAAYQDQAGVWTIGYGCTHGVSPGMTISQEQAEERLRQDLDDTAVKVKAQIHVPLNENQLCALVSFTFNEGSGHLSESTLETKLNVGDYAGAADEFLRWMKCRGVPVAGLLRRRQAERELFLSDS